MHASDTVGYGLGALTIFAGLGLAISAISPLPKAAPVRKPAPVAASLCEVDITDGILVRTQDGHLTSLVMIDSGEIYGEGTFVPCKELHRNRGA